METYIIDERLYLTPQLILAFLPLDLWERFVETRRGGVAHVGDEVGQVIGGLELDLALGLGGGRVCVHFV